MLAQRLHRVACFAAVLALLILAGCSGGGSSQYGDTAGGDTAGAGEGNSFGVHLVDVAVDLDTGKTDILRYTAIQDAGKVEVANPGHPYGVRGVGEVPIVPPLAAVANAVGAATGQRLTSLPIAPGSGMEREVVRSAAGRRRNAVAGFPVITGKPAAAVWGSQPEDWAG